MKLTSARLVALLFFLTSVAYSQVEKLAIPAGTPEDKDLILISGEQDAQKKLAMYQEFLAKYASNPMAVAYGNWQLSQYYQNAGDLQKALECGDKALAAAPHNLDILTSQVMIAQQAKDNVRQFKYSAEGGEVYNSIEKQPKPADLTQEQFAAAIASDKEANRSAYEFFRNAAFNSIASESNAKTRMDYIDQFATTFPKSGMEDQIANYAMLSLADLKDNKRLVAYADRVLAGNPEDSAALLMLANAYVDSPEPSALAKAVTYAQKTIVVAKAEQPDADRSRKVSAGVAHSILGRVYAKQEKTLPSITELKSAVALLKGQDEQQYAVAAYFLGWDYAKLNRLSDARAVLTDAAAIPGPMQPPIKELLTKVNSARAAGK